MPTIPGKKQSAPVFLELCKWLFVILLLIPTPIYLPVYVNFVRNALGLLLFIIFAGKLLYDLIIENRAHRAGERSLARDWVNIIGIVLALALIIGIILLFLTLYLFSYLNEILQTL